MAAKPKPRDFFTSRQVADLLGVSDTTVVNWIDSQRLPAGKTGGGHRRVARADLVAFARDHGYRLPRDVLVEHERPRVLVVDDDQDFAETVREYLSRYDFDVAVEVSGFSAGFEVRRHKPDVILLDLMMPTMDGFEVLSKLRGDEETCHVPVIACTGYRDPAMDERIREARFDNLVEKPLRLDKLVELLRKTLG